MDFGFWLLFFVLMLMVGPFADHFKVSGARRLVLLGALALALGATFFVFLLEHGQITSSDVRQVFGWLVAFLKMGAVVGAAVGIGVPELTRVKAS